MVVIITIIAKTGPSGVTTHASTHDPNLVTVCVIYLEQNCPFLSFFWPFLNNILFYMLSTFNHVCFVNGPDGFPFTIKEK